METYRIIVGIDWADQEHTVCVLDQQTQTKQIETVPQTPEAIAEWVASLRQRFPTSPIGVCLEQSRGALVYALLQYECLELVPVNPKQLARFREALAVSGAKDDPRDAELLAELLAKHGDCLRRWKPDTVETRLLGLLVADRRHLVDQRTTLGNRLKSLLKQYFPQALALCRTLISTVACALLERWPTLPQLQQATAEEIRQLYWEHDCRSEKHLQERLALIAAAVPLTRDAAIVESRSLLVVSTVRQIQALNEAIDQYDHRIAVLFGEHEDHDIFDSFPGAGAAMAPRLLTGFGTDRDRFGDASEVQQMTGIAPVTKASGKTRVVHRRWACNTFLRQTFHEYAAHSIKFSPWAKAYYDMMKQKTGKHHSAVRALAFKWTRILYRCWKTRTRYDELTYFAALQRRHSPLIAAMACSNN